MKLITTTCTFKFWIDVINNSRSPQDKNSKSNKIKNKIPNHTFMLFTALRQQPTAAAATATFQTFELKSWLHFFSFGIPSSHRILFICFLLLLLLLLLVLLLPVLSIFCFYSFSFLTTTNHSYAFTYPG